MSTQNNETTKTTEPVPAKGFLGSLFTRIDRALKEAAKKKAAGSCCSPGGKSGKGGKCC